MWEVWTERSEGDENPPAGGFGGGENGKIPGRYDVNKSCFNDSKLLNSVLNKF